MQGYKAPNLTGKFALSHRAVKESHCPATFCNTSWTFASSTGSGFEGEEEEEEGEKNKKNKNKNKS